MFKQAGDMTRSSLIKKKRDEILVLKPNITKNGGFKKFNK